MSATTTPNGGTAGGEPTVGDSPPEELSESELFEILSNPRRRYVLHAISGAEADTRELGALSEQVAAWENDEAMAEVSYDERKRVYTALQQSHLPRLDDAGLVEFDKDRGTVDATETLEDVEIYLDVVRGNEIPWSEYYLGLSGVSAALLTAVWVDAFPFTMLPDLAWFAFVVVAFTVSSLANRYYSREMKLGGGDDPPEFE